MIGYLDHNVLDLMTKGDPHNVKAFLKENDITPVFSYESLNEILKSEGYEQSFLDLLQEIEAKYLVPIKDGFSFTHEAELQVVLVHKLYEHYLQNKDVIPEYGYGLSGMLQKIYGGRQDESFSDIFSNGNEELSKLFVEGIESLRANPDVSQELIEQVLEIPEMVKTELMNISTKMDEEANTMVKSFESSFGVGPIVLNNIEAPDVLGKIWAVLEGKFDKFNVQGMELESFFGIAYQKHETNFGLEKPVVEKINSIYHQLNFIGYHRDSKMQKTNRFNASFSDMTHAGLASFCDYFLCRDNDLIYKAAAAYEYVGAKTKILHFKS
ncbi:hypothetical protein [Pseudoalteromonas distincta]|uniref:hypothetical protein n=1 Tax=Pseudoalteromonas distincta TaxID=77608 RepID=UPI0039E97A28